MLALTNGLRARAWKKFPTLRTYVADLLDSNFPGKGLQPWENQTAAGLDHLAPFNTRKKRVSPSQFGKMVKWKSAYKIYGCCTDVGNASYKKACFVATQNYLSDFNSVSPTIDCILALSGYHAMPGRLLSNLPSFGPYWCY